MRFCEQRDDARHADRSSSDDGIEKKHRLSVGAEEAVGTGRCRSGLAAIVSDEAIPLAVVDQHEGAAADAARLRLDEVQHELNGNGGVDCGAALLQDPVSRFDRKRVRGRDHEAAARHRRFVGPAGCALGRLVLRTTARDHRDQRDSQERASKSATDPTLHDGGLLRQRHCMSRHQRICCERRSEKSRPLQAGYFART